MRIGVPVMLVAVGLLLVAMLSIQFGAAVAKGLFPQIGPEGTTALRTLFAALVMVVAFRPWRGPLSREAGRAVALYGVSLGVMNLLFYQAIERIPLGVAVALEFTGPLAVTIAASRRALDAVWAGLAIVGIYMLLPSTSAAAAHDPAGVAFALGAGVCWALYIVFGKKVGSLMSGGRAASLGMVCAAVVTLPFGMAHAGAGLWAPAVLLPGFAVALLSGAVPYTMEMFALARMPTKTFGVLMSVEPAVAAVFGLLVLSEQLSPWQWGGIGCVIAASVGSTTMTRPSAALSSSAAEKRVSTTLDAE